MPLHGLYTSTVQPFLMDTLNWRCDIKTSLLRTKAVPVFNRKAYPEPVLFVAEILF